MKSKLLRRYFTAATVLIMSVLLFMGGALCWQVYKYSIKEKQIFLENKAEQISNTTSEFLSSYSVYSQKSFEFFLESVSDGGNIHVLICTPDGQIAMTSDDTNQAYRGVYLDEKITEKIFRERRYLAIGNLGGLYQGGNYTVGLPVINEIGKDAGYVLVTAPMSSMGDLLYDILKMFVLSALTVMILSAILSYLAVNNMTKPIKQISSAAKNFAQGDFAIRVPSNRDDEIGEMMDAFNNMADSLERSEELRRNFVANVSHELRSPMTSISGFVDGILDGTIPQEGQEKYLVIVSNEVKRLSRLVSRMLDITRLQTKDVLADCTRFDMCELIRRVIVGFENKMEEKGLHMEVSLCEYTVDVCANEDMIYQAVYNLTENAIKFSEPGGKIAINLTKRGGKICFSIKNNGETIPQSELAAVFDRFHKTDRSRGNDKTGLGLGLYIVKTIINQHKGDVSVTSGDNTTEFSFVIPVEPKKRQSNNTETNNI